MRYSTELNINLRILEDNYKKLQRITPHNETIFMIKANAYGHGLEEIARFSHCELSIKNFGVASIGEAMTLRLDHPDLKCQIYVFSDTEIIHEQYKEQYLDYNIIPVIHTLKQLEYILSDYDFRFMPIILKFDTGMNRLGIDDNQLEDVVKLLKKYSRSSIHHLMTHFSSSYIPGKDGDRTQRQYNAFCKIKSYLRDSGISIDETSVSNSGAIEQGIGLEESHIRPGLMLYGPYSTFTKGDDTPLWRGKSISSLKSKIIKVEEIKKGVPVGYGAQVCSEDGLLAYIPIGYGDGLLTYYSDVVFSHKNFFGKVMGRINMDLTAIWFPKAAIDSIKPNDELTLWDQDQNSIINFSNQAKSIPYQVYTSITKRVPRHYHYQ